MLLKDIRALNFLDLDDKTIIEAMINLFDDDDKFLFVINQEQSKKYKNKFDKIKKLKKNINFEIIKKKKVQHIPV